MIGTVVTEDNYMVILEKLKNICNKYKMLEFYSVYSKQGVKIYGSTPFNIRHDLVYSNMSIIKNKTPFKKVKRLYVRRRFVNVTEYTNTTRSLVVYNGRSLVPRIGLDLGPDEYIKICEGMIIRFLPGGGFVILEDTSVTNIFYDSSKIYKYTFIPAYIKGVITDAEHERLMRIKEWNDTCGNWDDKEEFLDYETDEFN